MKTGREILPILEKAYNETYAQVGYEPHYCIIHPKHRMDILDFFIERKYNTDNMLLPSNGICGGVELIFDNDLSDPDTYLILNEEMYKKYRENKRQFNSGFVNAMVNQERPIQYFK